MRSIGRITVCATLALGAFSSSGALAQMITLTLTSSFCYDMNIPGLSCAVPRNTGLLNQEVIEPNTPSLRLRTDYAYDNFGNKTQVTVSGADIATRSTNSTYDSRGQFVLQQTNALNQSESWQYDLRFGKPTSHTGPNGLTTTWQYDSFGRKILEVRADGTRTTFSYGSCANNACPQFPGSAYYVYMQPWGATGAPNGPYHTIHYDRLDREVYHNSQPFDGSWSTYISVQTQYDGLGRVLKKSRPFFSSGGTPQWTTYSYDALGRVTLESLPDGHTVQHGYHGLVTTDTNENGQTRTIVKNIQGQADSVTDAQGNVTRYYYDPFGNPLQTIDATGNNVVVNNYDLRGRKTASSDPDLGAWSYSYNALGQLTQQIDAKGQQSTFTYDLLGRLTQRVEADMTASWTYDTAPYGIGKLASASASGPATGGNGFQRSLSYDALGRPVGVSFWVEGYFLQWLATYDGDSRLSTVRYHTGFMAQYNYNSVGYLTQLVDATTGQMYWTANARDAELHLTHDTVGNGVDTIRGFDAATGRLGAIYTGPGSGVANFAYGYDGVGNLTSRLDHNNNIAEGFGYDALNRLTSSSITTSSGPVAKFFSYDSVGNLLTKSDVGNYGYPAPGQPRPHGVLSVDGGEITATFSYDPNGNQTAAAGSSFNRLTSYHSYNKPASITQGSLTLSFGDDVDHQRFEQVAVNGTARTFTAYFDAFGVHAEVISSSSGAWQWNDYLMVSGSMVGMRIWRNDNSVSLRYFHQDHLGSIAAITDENGQVVERNAYDPWGKRRFWSNGADDVTDSIASLTSRGFTGEEMLASVGLVHLNGRVYDPYIGRMTSADPVVGDLLNGQTWNRYSYVYNNPLAFADPTGYCPNCIGIVNPQPAGPSGLLQFAETAFQIAGGAICLAGGGACTPFMPLISSTISAYFAGVTSGSLLTALKAGGISFATAMAFKGVGDLTGHRPEFGDGPFFANVAGHALVGCGSSVASGGKCGPGALSAAVSAFAGPLINQLPFQAALVANTTIGGFASVAGGGKFLSGAVTAAFGYLFNWWGEKEANMRKCLGMCHGYTFDSLTTRESTSAENNVLSSVIDLLTFGMFGRIPGATGVATDTSVATNRLAGNAFRDELADLLQKAGRQVETEVYKTTPFGGRFIDIEVSMDGQVLGGIETKLGDSRYLPSQQAKDMWLKLNGYPVNVVRGPLP